MECLKEMSQSLDRILDIPPEQWNQREINLYHLLQRTLEKYKVRYSLAQFKLDLRDIKNNVKEQNWYTESPYKKTIDWCLNQLIIKSYQHSKKSNDYRLIARFSEVQASVMILYRKEKSYFTLKNPLSESDLEDIDKISKMFGINSTTPDIHRINATKDIIKLIEEIALFYIN